MANAPENCLSKVAQALRENWHLFSNSEWVDARTREAINNMTTPVVETLANLDTKEKSATENATEKRLKMTSTKL